MNSILLSPRTLTAAPRLPPLITLAAVLWAGGFGPPSTAHAQGTVVASWEGIPNSAGHTQPPDSNGAPGPAGVLEAANFCVAYFDKSGNFIWGPINVMNFWNGISTSTSGVGDVKVIFDYGTRRFFVIMQENNNSHFWLNLAVSRSSDPRSSGSSDWIFYRLDATEYAGGNPVGGVNYGGDYPGLAVDGQALYVAYTMYSFNPDGSWNGGGGGVTNCALLILDKNRLIDGTGTLVSLYLENGPNLQPAMPLGGNPGNVVYLVRNWANGYIKVYSVLDPLGVRTVVQQLINRTDRGGGPSTGAPQLGSGNQIATLAFRTQAAMLVNGDLWFSSTLGQPSGPAVVAYYRLRMNSWPSAGLIPSLVEDSTVGDVDYWNFQPAIGLNPTGDVAITWTRSSSTTYPTMMAAARNTGDGTFGAPQVIKASTSANTDGRWGDFASVFPDPNDGSLWIVHEWVRSNTGVWSTWWVRIAMQPQDLYINLNAPFPLFQNGSLAFPYTSIGVAHAAVAPGVSYVFHIFGAHYNEIPTLSRSIRLESYDGNPVVIGRP